MKIYPELLLTVGVVCWNKLSGCWQLKDKKNSPLTINNLLKPNVVIKGNLTTDFFNCEMLNINKTTEKWTKGCIFPFPKKSDLRIIKNYRDITLIAIAAKVYKALLHYHIQSEFEKILWKNQNGFQRNQSTISQILTIHQIMKTI